jgi:hypothetical protein
MRVYSNLAESIMQANGSFVGYFKVVMLTRSPGTPSPAAAPSINALLDGIGYQELVDSHYTSPGERPLVQILQGTVASGAIEVRIGQDIALPDDVAPTFTTAVAFYWHGTDPAGAGSTLNGVVNPWLMITDESFGMIVNPGSVLTTVSQPVRVLWSWARRGPAGGPYVADKFASGLVRSPGTVAWEPPRTQHIYLYPQKINYVPNPSFEDAGGPGPVNFGWRANGTLTRAVGGVDSALKNFGRVTGTRLESVPSLIPTRFATISAYIRSAPTAGVRLNGGSGDYIVGPDIAAFAGATSITAEVDCTMDDWTPATTQSLVGQYAGTGTFNSWEMSINTAGTVGVFVSGDGLVAGQRGYVSTAPTLTNGTRHTIRAEWLAVDGANSSTQFKVDGTNQGSKITTTTLPAGPFNTSWPVALGARANGTPATRLIGTIHGAKIWANGVLVASPDFTRMTAGQTSATDAQGNVWSLAGAAAVDSPVASKVQMGLCNWNAAWTPVEDKLSEQKSLTSTWTRHHFVTLMPDGVAGSGALFVSNGSFDVDLVMLEQGADLSDYFDGDAATGILGDFTWKGVTHRSLSLWYNNRNLVGARLFGVYHNGLIEQDGLVYDWVPAGTSIHTHWDVLNPQDTGQPMVDFTSRLTGPRALSLPGVSGTYVSTPDAAKFDITGDLCLMAKVNPVTWSAGTIVSKWSGVQCSYQLSLASAGSLYFSWSANGSTILTQQSVGGFSATATPWVAATLDVDNGNDGSDVKFWSSLDGVTWKQMGTPSSQSITSVFPSTTPINIGANTGGTASLLKGQVQDVRIYNGIGINTAPGQGTLVGHFSVAPGATSTYTDELNNVWTVNGTLWSYGPAL